MPIGPDYTPAEIRAAIQGSLVFSRRLHDLELPEPELLRRTAAIIAEGKFSAGIKGARNGARGRSATAALSPILAARK